MKQRNILSDCMPEGGREFQTNQIIGSIPRLNSVDNLFTSESEVESFKIYQNKY